MLRALAAAVLLQAWRDTGHCQPGRVTYRCTHKCNLMGDPACDVLAFWRSDDCKAMCDALNLDWHGALDAVQRKLCR